MAASPAVADPVRIGLIGTGRIGGSHARLLARRVPGARLVALADARPGVADALAEDLGCPAFWRRTNCWPRTTWRLWSSPRRHSPTPT